MKKLFIMYIGGQHEKSFIELHDMRFMIGRTIEDTYEDLRKSWWGTPQSLHLDAWGCLTYADGHEIHIKDEPQVQDDNKLYFVNLGGYDRHQFTELHKNVFVVARSDSKAKVKALKQILNWESHHRDNQFEVEKIINVTDVLLEDHIHLLPTTEVREFEFICKYVPIGKKEEF